MNSLFVGMSKKIELPRRGFLIITDEVLDIPRSRIFDPTLHSLNPLKDLSYKRAREIAEIVYTVFPQGEQTLTVRNGKRTLLAELLNKWKAPRLDKLKNEEVGDLLMSPVLRRVLCQPTNFSFNPRSVIQARISRVELGELDSLTLGLILMATYKGVVVLPDAGFYLRDLHMSLIREKRLIAGLSFLSELPPKLRNNVLLFDRKDARGCTVADAEVLATYEGLIPNTNGFNDYVAAAIS